MNLYLVSRMDDVAYDEFESFVIACRTPEAAQRSTPKLNADHVYRGEVWTEPKNVLVRHIGIAHSGIEDGEILCASFNAG